MNTRRRIEAAERAADALLGNGDRLAMELSMMDASVPPVGPEATARERQAAASAIVADAERDAGYDLAPGERRRIVGVMVAAW